MAEQSKEEFCDECGREVAGGRAGCRAYFDELVARDFSNPTFFRTHNLLVDPYCLQHPQQFCQSGKSLAAHLANLCAILERNKGSARIYEPLKQWLDGPRQIEKPRLPTNRGRLTIACLASAGDDPDAVSRALHDWAKEVWAAYADLQPLARRWLESAGVRQ